MREIVICSNCECDCSAQHYMCDQDDWTLCPDCFEKTACAAGVHGEGCPTLVLNGDTSTPAPKPMSAREKWVVTGPVDDLRNVQHSVGLTAAVKAVLAAAEDMHHHHMVEKQGNYHCEMCITLAALRKAEGEQT